MEKKRIEIDGIPALLWGGGTEGVYIAVHGDMASKEDPVIEALAEAVAPEGWRVLSFDLPEHGERAGGPKLAKPQVCVPELEAVLRYAGECWPRVRLFAVSIGAYFALQAYGGAALEKALFLSPIVDMGHLIGSMMGWFGVTEEALREKQQIETPMGKTLYWDYYSYVKGQPVESWPVPTAILCGEGDTLNPNGIVEGFAARFDCTVEVLAGGEHWFHTPEQMQVLRDWLAREI